MFKFSSALVRSSKSNAAFGGVLRLNFFSAVTSTAEAKNVVEPPQEAEVKKPTPANKGEKKPLANQTIVAAAFASLQSESAIINNGIKTPFTDNKIAEAKTVEELLSLSEGSGVSRRHALKVVSILANWANTGKVNMGDFETDVRFLKLCRVLAKGMNQKSNKVELRSEDLSTILTVTADDEAAKLVESITLSQMVKVMSTLSLKKRRSTMLLRALSYNITKNSDKLDLKQCADLLFSMAVLNFPDINLLERIKNDTCANIETSTKRSAVVGSILTSIGLLKYKNADLLEVLTNWVIKNNEICRSQDLVAMFLTMAVLNYKPQQFDKLVKTVMPQLTFVEVGKPNIWLEYIWSLVILEKASGEQIASVLEEKFISTVSKDENIASSTSLKLLNIDAACDHLLKDYKGPRLSPEIKELNFIRTKDKEEMVNSVYDALKNLMLPETHLKQRVPTKMGFYIDAFCVLDKKCKPIAISKATNDHIKVAVMVQDYHDLCKGDCEATGMNIFAYNLLKKQGYTVLTVPYTEFKPQEKLIQRVKYIESKLKSIVEL